MCGILGYKGQRNGTPIVHQGLKELSYRGYDSWGIAAHSNNAVSILKKIGDITKETDITIESKQVIGHTRWATHGGVTDVNAHPHTNSERNICVVHNGIIENYAEIKEELKAKGYEFNTETDTEVIPQLIDYHVKSGKTFQQAFEETLTQLKGNYAMLATKTENDGILFARNGSPLVIGVGTEEYFVSSDIPSFLEHTKTLMQLEDGDYGWINGKIDVYNKGQKVNRQTTEANWDIETAKKGEYPHFMIKEINEQPITIRKALNQEKEIIEKTTQLLRNSSTVFLVGCGTSYYTCATATYQFAKTGKQTIATLGSEFEHHAPYINENTTVIAVSQSGETADVVDALKIAKTKGAKIVSIVNVVSSTIARMSDIIIPARSGPEICVLSTKTFTAQLAILEKIALTMQGKNDTELEKAAEKAQQVLKEQNEPMKELAGKLAKKEHIFVIGRNSLSQIAREAALKIKEVSYIHAEGMPAGELKHGSIALIEQGTPVIVFSNDETRTLTTSNAMEVKARGAYVIGIDTENNKAYDYFIKIPLESTLLSILPVHLLAYYLALERKCDPDKPRNLAKSVTVR